MKNKIKVLVFFTCLFLLSMIYTFSYAAPDELNIKEAQRKSEFKLPASLTVIEESAFEGTAITSVDLPDTVKNIGDNAFANIKSLQNIVIPDSTSYIGKNAFKGSDNVIISGTPKGYAHAWARENGIPFAPVVCFCANNNNNQVSGASQGRNQFRQLLFDDDSENGDKTKPTGRMSGELSASRYEGCTAFHIQGRSPPMS